MGTDQFIMIISKVSMYLLPVAGLVLLVFLILFFRHLIVALKSLNQTLLQTTKMVEDCDVQIKKLDKPLNTINELSDTVDNVHEMTKSALSSTIALIINNLSAIKDKFMNKKNDTCESSEEVFEESEES